jgi:Fe-S cluster assembly protein SufD
MTTLDPHNPTATATGEDYKFTPLAKMLRGFNAPAHGPAPRLNGLVSTASAGPGVWHVPARTRAFWHDDLDLAASTWVHRDTTIHVDDGAELVMVHGVRGAGALTHPIHISVGREARLLFVHYHLGAAMARTEVQVHLVGAGACADLRAVGSLETGAHGDCTWRVHHLVPHTWSRQTLRHVVAPHATGVFQGLIHVAVGASQTDAAQNSQAVIVDNTATMHMKPELEIFNDDVTCAHGAAVGAMDPEHLFYLMARGLSPLEARALLTWAFLGVALADLPDDVMAMLPAIGQGEGA